ncbi:hypothetical protein EIP91_005510 [Steccherinum ochraceum]|uniref:Uncharacterized protein n=1 Tax=Steccherinum ochraceum TaxID=92696 RepID=A0A4R0S467_9APHY|nr:hypothetical protein EIP91_005510 [Steccherinum ochraceum]
MVGQTLDSSPSFHPMHCTTYNDSPCLLQGDTPPPPIFPSIYSVPMANTLLSLPPVVSDDVTNVSESPRLAPSHLSDPSSSHRLHRRSKHVRFATPICSIIPLVSGPGNMNISPQPLAVNKDTEPSASVTSGYNTPVAPATPFDLELFSLCKPDSSRSTRSPTLSPSSTLSSFDSELHSPLSFNPWLDEPSFHYVSFAPTPPTAFESSTCQMDTPASTSITPLLKTLTSSDVIPPLLASTEGVPWRAVDGDIQCARPICEMNTTGTTSDPRLLRSEFNDNPVSSPPRDSSHANVCESPGIMVPGMSLRGCTMVADPQVPVFIRVPRPPSSLRDLTPPCVKLVVISLRGWVTAADSSLELSFAGLGPSYLSSDCSTPVMPLPSSSAKSMASQLRGWSVDSATLAMIAWELFPSCLSFTISLTPSRFISLSFFTSLSRLPCNFTCEPLGFRIRAICGTSFIT